jgi:hypothetical protein
MSKWSKKDIESLDKSLKIYETLREVVKIHRTCDVVNALDFLLADMIYALINHAKTREKDQTPTDEMFEDFLKLTNHRVKAFWKKMNFTDKIDRLVKGENDR